MQMEYLRRGTAHDSVCAFTRMKWLSGLFYFDRNDRQSGLRASLGAFTGQVFHSFGDDLVVHIDYSISVEFIYTGADFGTDSITAACGLIDNHLQPF